MDVQVPKSFLLQGDSAPDQGPLGSASRPPLEARPPHIFRRGDAAEQTEGLCAVTNRSE